MAKLERICEKLDLDPQDRVLEIGSGWGAFALYAARTRGCHVTTTTISREQHQYVLEQVRRTGLGDKVTVLMDDYRELRGRFDKVVQRICEIQLLLTKPRSRLTSGEHLGSRDRIGPHDIAKSA